jgi:hypothetical protein
VEVRDLRKKGLPYQVAFGLENEFRLVYEDLPRPLFEYHTRDFCGEDECMRQANPQDDGQTLKGRVLTEGTT